jgi:hypothetical protein
MIEEKDTSQVAPSLAKIAVATMLAMTVAIVILIVAVLPAEYGIDPLGTGKAFGLSDLATASEKQPAPPVPNPEAAIVPVLEPAVDGGAPRVEGTFIARPNRYKIDSREIKLAPREGMEIKYSMKKGSGLIYSWIASEPLFFEFHGEPNVKPAGKEGTDYYETYELDDKVGKNQSHGTFIAPSAGIHGWFWENKSDKEVNLKLVTAGFYDWVFQNRNDKETALKAMEADSVPSHPKIPDEILH